MYLLDLIYLLPVAFRWGFDIAIKTFFQKLVNLYVFSLTTYQNERTASYIRQNISGMLFF